MSNIEPTLVLSTANISEQTCNEFLPTAPFGTYQKGDHGWWVHVAREDEDDIPRDLAHAFALARHLDCCWIMFDCDAPEDPRLETFAW